MDIEALGYEAAVALTQPDDGEPPLRDEGDLFDLTLEKLAEPRMWQQARGKEAKDGDRELVPYFYTKPTARSRHPDQDHRAADRAARAGQDHS